MAQLAADIHLSARSPLLTGRELDKLNLVSFSADGYQANLTITTVISLDYSLENNRWPLKQFKPGNRTRSGVAPAFSRRAMFECNTHNDQETTGTVTVHFIPLFALPLAEAWSRLDGHVGIAKGGFVSMQWEIEVGQGSSEDGTGRDGT